MKDLETFFRVNIKDWVYGTIEKVRRGDKWNVAWQKTYQEIGGKSIESGKKVCPMKAAKTLYLLGRIKGSDMERKDPSPHQILTEHSKNGVYAIYALDELKLDPKILLPELWEKIQSRVRSELNEEPAKSNQGGPTIAFKLWHLDLIDR